MKERPIPFKGDMVRAILYERKTETRRVVKGGPWFDNVGSDDLGVTMLDENCKEHYVKCPYGQPGDRLWVRETMASDGDDWWFPACGRGVFTFPTDETEEYREDVLDWMARQRKANRVTVPSIHMPRWASRILLEITEIKVERVQDITEEGAENEGISYLREIPDIDETLTAKDLFSCLWDSINEKRGYSWDSNPWVWVVKFKVLEVKA